MKYKSFWFEIISNFNLTEGLKTCNHADETPSLFTFKTFLAIDFNPIFKIINEKCFFCSLLPRWVITTMYCLVERAVTAYTFFRHTLNMLWGNIVNWSKYWESVCLYVCVCVFLSAKWNCKSNSIVFCFSFALPSVLVWTWKIGPPWKWDFSSEGTNPY